MDRDQIVSHLPALLRYARSLTRSRQEGEFLVETALELLANGDTRLDASMSLRSALLERVHETWIPLDGTLSAGDDKDDGLFATLSRVPPRDRAALLLVRFEGLTEAEAAKVLHVSEAEVLRRLMEAERRLFRLPHPRVLIVIDEPPEGLDLQELVTELGCEAVGPVGFAEALAAAASEKPDLMLSSATHAALTECLAAAEAISREQGIPLILLLDDPDKTSGQIALERSYIVEQPFDRTQIEGLIRRAIRQGQSV